VKGELERIGYIGDQEPGHHPIGAYFETHIEQGPVLEDHDVTIGVVHRRAGHPLVRLHRHRHGGPRRPDADGLRKDALQVGHASDAGGGGHRHAPPAAWPRHRGHGARAPEQPQRDPRPREVQHRPAQRHRRAGATPWTPRSAPSRQVATDSGWIEIEQVSATRRSPSTPTASTPWPAPPPLGYSHMPAVSGAGHDAVYMARLAPAGMIFIPCKDGISHNEIEDAKPEHITAGCNVLLHAMLERG
jgi:N-carbamoyl-L-amino-acid hydrolase